MGGNVMFCRNCIAASLSAVMVSGVKPLRVALRPFDFAQDDHRAAKKSLASQTQLN